VYAPLMDRRSTDPVAERAFLGLASGDVGAAATAAIEGYGAGVFRYLTTILDEDDARDAHATWAEDVWRGLPGFRRECSLRAWAYRLARNASCRLRRDPYRVRGQRLASTAASRLAVSVVGSTVATGSRREGLRRLRAMLDEDDRALLNLRVDRELEWDEIAVVMSSDGRQVTSQTLRKRFERLKRRLRELALREGLLEA
jgi:RNA polymerase sigma-70 factor, ECF subfamily